MKKRAGISPCHFNTAVAVCCTGGSGAYVSHTITSDASFRRIVIYAICRMDWESLLAQLSMLPHQ